MRFEKFINGRLSFCRLGFLLLLLITMFSGCKKEMVNDPASLVRLEGLINLSHADTSVTLRWEKAFTAWEGENRPAVQYELEVSLDPTFADQAQEAYEVQTDSTFIHLNRNQLEPFEIYYARVRAIAGPNEARSGWLLTDEFHILDQVREINLFRSVKNHDLADRGVILRWERDNDHQVTSIVVSTEGAEDQPFLISGDDNANTRRMIEGLTPDQKYEAHLFAGERNMGTVSFKTKTSVDDQGYVDLRQSGDPMVLENTLNTVPEGSTIVLRRGMTYTITQTFSLNRGVTIMSERGFDRQAHIQMSSSFDVDAPATVSLIKFEDVEITGDIESTYVFNLSAASTINRIEFEACLINEHRGVVRLKDAGSKTVTDYVINNSIVQNIGGYGLLNVDHEDATLNNVHLTNSTIINAEWIARYGNSQRNDLDVMLIESSTFLNAPHNNRFVIDMQRTGSTIGSFIARNTLFGFTTGARPFNRFAPASISVINSFATSDAHWDRGLIDGVTAYPRTSAQVFAAPDINNFTNSDLTIMDEELYTVGDPRWRP